MKMNSRMMYLRTIFCAAVISFMSTTNVNAQGKPFANKDNFFPFSVWYSGGTTRATMLADITPKSREEWKKDIQQIKSLGFNSVKTWIEWSHCEPRKGRYNFENLKMVCELAKEAGLRVIIQVYGESAPEWVQERNSRMVYLKLRMAIR